MEPSWKAYLSIWVAQNLNTVPSRIGNFTLFRFTNKQTLVRLTMISFCSFHWLCMLSSLESKIKRITDTLTHAESAELRDDCHSDCLALFFPCSVSLVLCWDFAVISKIIAWSGVIGGVINTSLFPCLINKNVFFYFFVIHWWNELKDRKPSQCPKPQEKRVPHREQRGWLLRRLDGNCTLTGYWIAKSELIWYT